ncbi:hypothetical protein COBT_001143 [Conglomerata obtusa]
MGANITNKAKLMQNLRKTFKFTIVSGNKTNPKNSLIRIILGQISIVLFFSNLDENELPNFELEYISDVKNFDENLHIDKQNNMEKEIMLPNSTDIANENVTGISDDDVEIVIDINVSNDDNTKKIVSASKQKIQSK